MAIGDGNPGIGRQLVGPRRTADENIAPNNLLFITERRFSVSFLLVKRLEILLAVDRVIRSILYLNHDHYSFDISSGHAV